MAPYMPMRLVRAFLAYVVLEDGALLLTVFAAVLYGYV
jgi:hypothetical protein